MEKFLWFIYGFMTAIGVIVLGIVGWGVSMLYRVISYAPLGFVVVASVSLVIFIVFTVFVKRK